MNIKLIIFIKGILIFTICSSVVGQTRVLDVPNSAAPSGSNWCWAVCTHMATQYYGNSTELCTIVEWARQNLADPDRGNDNCCSYPDSCFGGAYVSTLDEVLASEGLSCSIVYNIVSLSTLQSTINDNRPIIIQGHHNTPNYGWHTMIIKGYDGSDIHYNDGGSSFITSYNDAITTDCMGTWLWRWQNYSHILTGQPCPVNLNLTQEIDANADISAQNNIVLSCEIGTNRSIILTAGNSITFNSGFVIPVGSTLDANVVTNPCQ